MLLVGLNGARIPFQSRPITNSLPLAISHFRSSVYTNSFRHQLKTFFYNLQHSGLFNAPPTPPSASDSAGLRHCALYKFTYLLNNRTLLTNYTTYYGKHASPPSPLNRKWCGGDMSPLLAVWAAKRFCGPRDRWMQYFQTREKHTIWGY